MTHPVHPAARSAISPNNPSGPAGQHRGGSFAELLRSDTQGDNPPGPSLGQSGAELLRRVSSGERYIDSMVRQGLTGHAFTNAELLTMQARIYRYTQEVELVSKIVDKTTGSVKTVLQSGGG